MPTVEELNWNFATALEIRLHGEYLRGKVEGLRVAKLIRDWLTRQPDRAWQKQVREWADKEIANAEVSIASRSATRHDGSQLPTIPPFTGSDGSATGCICAECLGGNHIVFRGPRAKCRVCRKKRVCVWTKLQNVLDQRPEADHA